jgi:carbamoyltransferase
MCLNRYYIGLACTYHDPAVAILDKRGTILFAEATERSIQSKRAWGMPSDGILYTKSLIKKYCPDASEVVLSYSWGSAYLNKLLFQSFFNTIKIKQAFLNFLLSNISSHVLTADDILGMYPLQLSCINQAGQSFIKVIRSLLPGCKIKIIHHPHHFTHAAYACHTSPFQEGTCVVADGYGEKGSFSVFRYRKNQIRLLSSNAHWGSLGFFYSLITRLCGFDPDKGEAWKVMGLASYGQLDEMYYQLLKSMVRVNGLTFRFTLFKPWIQALRALSAVIEKDSFSIKEAANMAHTGQVVFSEIMEELLHNVYNKYRSDRLIYTGGCALNSSFNGQILHRTKFKQLYVPPAPGDDGNAIGAALRSYYHANPGSVSIHNSHSPYLGAEMSSEALDHFIHYSGTRKVSRLLGSVHEKAAQLLSEGKLIGWIQHRAEFGPRALGNRSILADPRSPQMKDRINSHIKFREAFRPFAPSILHEFGPEYFEDYKESPFMERSLRFRKQVWDKVPAVVHVDHTGRLQSVKRDANPKFYDLIYAFYRITNVPLVLNTSFNVMGKPIIHSIEDAISVFFTCGLDAMVIDDYLIEK